MLSGARLSTTSKAAVAVALLLCAFTACRNPKPQPSPSTPPVKYNKSYDAEIREIMDLAGKGRWEEAQIKATALREMAP